MVFAIFSIWQIISNRPEGTPKFFHSFILGTQRTVPCVCPMFAGVPKHRWGACAERLPRALRALAMTQRVVPCSPFPVPWCLVGAGYLWRSMIAATERVCSLFPVACSPMPRRSGVPVAIDDRRYRAGLFPVACSLFPGVGDCHGPSGLAMTQRAVPCSLLPRRSGVPVAIDDRRYRAGLFPVPRSLFPGVGDCHGPCGPSQ